MNQTDMRQSVLVCGEALFDVFPDQTGSDDGVWPLLARAGGSPFNVAIGLARLGRSTAFFGGLSTDAMGQALAAQLAREGVDASLSPRLAKRTTLSFVAHDASGQPAYSFYGEDGADRSLTPPMCPATLDGFAAIHVGSYSLVVEPSGSTLAGLVALVGQRLVTYDPNVRLTVEPDRQLWRDAVARIGRDATVIKVSTDDMALLDPGIHPATAAAALLDLGSSLVVVTDGDRGATAFTRTTQVHCPARHVTVVDTVGAGDSFMAALIDGLLCAGTTTRAAVAALSADEIGAILTRCARAASFTCTRIGADPPSRDDLGKG